MTGPCFVDANVFVYARDPRDPVKQARAKAWRDHLWRTGTGRTSVQALSETYWTLRRIPGADADDAWEGVARLFAWNPRSVDEEVLHLGRIVERRFRIAWWDSLIVAAAQLQDCKTLLTEDLHEGMSFDGLIVRNPFTTELREDVASYMLGGAARHRARGRPRRIAGQVP